MGPSLSLALALLLRLQHTALSRTFPVQVCSGHEGKCIHSKECASEWIYDSQCQRGEVCCINHFTKENLKHNADTKIRLRFYIDNERSLLHFLLPTLKYSEDDSRKDSEESRIVNIKGLKSSPTINIATASKFRKEEDNVIVFPVSSEDENDIKIKSIERLFQKFTKNFNGYNSIPLKPDQPIRKLKYHIGYKSTKYCTLYETYMVNESLMATPLLPSPFPVMMQETHCSKPLPLIVGGMDASKGEFPHMAALGYDRGEWIDFLCGGSLISERFILTAGHCGNTKWGPPIIVRLGTRNLITDDGQNMDVEKVIIHPDYKEPSCYNDVALIKIAAGLKISKNLRPACLPSLTTTAGDPGRLLTATGWGKTGYGLFSSPNLQKVSLEVIDNKTCDQMFLGGRKTERLPSGIQSSMLCASGYEDSTRDTCQGDSGGPLQAMTQHSKCMYEVVGITSFGKLCGTGLPAIYTRVSTYIPWIEDIVWPS